jgi:hypothetical protein
VLAALKIDLFSQNGHYRLPFLTARHAISFILSDLRSSEAKWNAESPLIKRPARAAVLGGGDAA